jgi:magnesium-transporting ATPase (P-type)
MPTAYPTTLPLPKVEGFSTAVRSGLIKTDNPSHQAQRRVFTNMPMRFALTFTMTVNTWSVWHGWVMANGFRWFTMRLPTMYAGLAGTALSPVLIRFVSDPVASTVSLTDVQIVVQAETAPSAIDAYLDAI